MDSNTQEMQHQLIDVCCQELEDEHQSQTKLPLKKRHPTCARCRNHGLILNLKGHKKHCQYRTCECVRCKLVSQRRQVMARQVAMSREQEKQREKHKMLENFEHLPESQRFYQPEVVEHRPDMTDAPVNTTVAENLIQSFTEPLHSPAVNKDVEYCSRQWDEGHASTGEGLVTNQKDFPETYYSAFNHSQLADEYSSRLVGQTTYVTMKEHACQQFDTKLGAPLEFGSCTSSLHERSPATLHLTSETSVVPSNMSSYRNMSPSAQSLYYDSYPPPIPNSATNVGLMPEPNFSPPIELSIPPAGIPSAGLAQPITNHIGIAGPPQSPMTITLPPLGQVQEYTCSQPLSPLSAPYEPCSSHVALTGITCPPSEMNSSYQLYNYPSPTLPTQSTPVFSFPPPTNPPDPASNTPLSYYEHMDPTALQPTYAFKETQPYLPLDQNRQCCDEAEFEDCEIDVINQ